MKIRNEKGFTLIELVMVIVILAILAAVAVPRFINLQDDARVSTAKGVAGAVSGAANILHSQFLLKNTGYILGTTGGPDTGILFNANIAGATVTPGNTVLTNGSNASSTVSINLGGATNYTMTITLTGNGPQVGYGF